MVRLAIADPPYPPLITADGGSRTRASRWYGTNQHSSTDIPSDVHPDAAEWDDPARHRRLIMELADTYDGWAIATAPDGIAAYSPLPVGTRIMAWMKPFSQPGSHRLLSRWEPVLLYPPIGRRSNRNGAGGVPDALVANLGGGFIGAKPEAWTRWVLDALTYDPESDTVDDLFPGSGAVTHALAQGTLFQ